ncbi:MAG: nuclear transport factor 2 family protein [Gemmatimonadota bacterium]|jgi:ketosteroid isomerase-like protein
MRRKLTSLAVSIAILLSASALQAQRAPEPLQDLIDKWEAAFNAGNYEALSRLYTTDAIRMPPGEDLIQGQEAIVQRNQQFAGFTIKLEAFSGLIGEANGSTWGTYTLNGIVDGTPVTIEGRWMNAVKKTNEGWRIHRDIWHEMRRS